MASRRIPWPYPDRLTQLAEDARQQGLRYVYVGNVLGSDDQNTHCPRCGILLVERKGYVIRKQLLAPTGGVCPNCDLPIAGVWS